MNTVVKVSQELLSSEPFLIRTIQAVIQQPDFVIAISLGKSYYSYK